MQARSAIDGQIYNLLGKGSRPRFKGAVCNGWNSSHAWVLFVVSDDRGNRKMTLMMPDEEIQPVDQ